MVHTDAVLPITKLLYLCAVEELRPFTERSACVAVEGSAGIRAYAVAFASAECAQPRAAPLEHPLLGVVASRTKEHRWT
jgi:hypothetical protein